jgi:heptosyltransferase I
VPPVSAALEAIEYVQASKPVLAMQHRSATA